jgi:hypothetical protein
MDMNNFILGEFLSLDDPKIIIQCNNLCKGFFAKNKCTKVARFQGNLL